MFFLNFALLIEQNRHPVFGIFHYFLPASLLSQTLLPTLLIQIKLACVQKTKTLHLQCSRQENLNKNQPVKSYLFYYTGSVFTAALQSFKESEGRKSACSFTAGKQNTAHSCTSLHTCIFFDRAAPEGEREKITLSEAASEAGGQLTQLHLPFQPRGHGWTPRGCVLCGLSERSR